VNGLGNRLEGGDDGEAEGDHANILPNVMRERFSLLRLLGHTGDIVKKPWIIALVAVVVLCCGGGGIVTFLLVRAGMDVMADAKAYGDQSVTAICTNWDASALSSRATPELIAQNPDGTLEGIVQTMKVVGPMKSIESSSIGGIEAKSATGGKPFTQAEYKATILCEKSKVDVKLTILKRDGKWEILNVNFQEVK